MSATVFLRLLHHGLVTQRQAIRDGAPDVAEGIADLLHTLPLELIQLEEGARSSDDVLTDLRERAQRLGCARWLESALDEIDA